MTESTCVDETTLLRLLDADLTAGETTAAERHVAACPHCGARLRRLTAIGSAAAMATVLGEASSSVCADELTLASFAEGRLAEAERGPLVEHLAGCHRCVSALAALGRELATLDATAVTVPAWALSQARGLVEDATAAARPGSTAAAGWWDRWLAAFRAQPGLGLAGAAAMLLVVALIFPLGGGLDDGALRGGAGPPSIQLLSPIEQELVTATGLDLRWREVPAAASYTVTIMDQSGGFFWQGQSATPSLRLPDDVALSAGALYSWWVEALLEEGRTIESRRQTFLMRP